MKAEARASARDTDGAYFRLDEWATAAMKAEARASARVLRPEHRERCRARRNEGGGSRLRSVDDAPGDDWPHEVGPQ